MQRIERYGVVTLVLLLGTITAVSFWDDGSMVPGKGVPKGKQRAAQQLARQTPGAKGPQSRVLPAVAGREQQRAATSKRKGAAQAKFKTLAQNVVSPPKTKPRAKSQSQAPLKVPAPLKNNRAAYKAPQPRPTTNYDTIEQRKVASQQKRPLAQVPARQSPATSPVNRAVLKASGNTYTVAAGDTLSEIAGSQLGSAKRWREIQALNGNLDPSALWVGQELKLPTGAALTVAGRQAAVTLATPGGYVVKSGDVLSQIAQDVLGGASRWREIVALNPGLDPKRLMAGAVLTMPGAPTRVASLSTTPLPTTKKRNRVR